MTIFHCGNCQQPLTREVAPGEPLRGPERPVGHEVVSSRMAPGTFKVNFDASLLIFHPDDVPGAALHANSRRLAGCCGLAGQDGPTQMIRLAELMAAGRTADADPVQAEIDAQYRAPTQLRAVSAEEYRAIGRSCVDNDAWRTAYEAIATGLAAYQRDAIEVYATTRLN